VEGFALVPILLFSVIVHEIAHGLMALKLGDPTAKELGRLTLNPIPHIDPIGSILVPLISYLTAGTVFIAWAKPVPVNPANFQNRRRDDILVSVVGPLSNLLVALVCTFGYVAVSNLFPMDSLADGTGDVVASFVSDMMLMGISLNIYLAVFNMIPVPPLDGSHVLASLLPPASPAATGIRFSSRAARGTASAPRPTARRASDAEPHPPIRLSAPASPFWNMTGRRPLTLSRSPNSFTPATCLPPSAPPRRSLFNHNPLNRGSWFQKALCFPRPNY